MPALAPTDAPKSGPCGRYRRSDARPNPALRCGRPSASDCCARSRLPRSPGPGRRRRAMHGGMADRGGGCACRRRGGCGAGMRPWRKGLPAPRCALADAGGRGRLCRACGQRLPCRGGGRPTGAGSAGALASAACEGPWPRPGGLMEADPCGPWPRRGRACRPPRRTGRENVVGHHCRAGRQGAIVAARGKAAIRPRPPLRLGIPCPTPVRAHGHGGLDHTTEPDRGRRRGR